MFHSFDIEDAKKYGVIEATILQNMKFWIAHNKANKKHFHDGRYWTYNSVSAFEELFPYLTYNQIRRALEKLVECNVLVCGNYNNSTYDRTKWYSLFDQMDLANLPNGIGDDAKTVNTDINTNQKPVIKPSAAKNSPLVDLPDWIPLENWNAFIENRKQLKKPATEKAIKLLIAKLETFKNQGHNIAEILDQSTISGWSGVFLVNKASKQSSGSQHQDQIRAFMERHGVRN